MVQTHVGGAQVPGTSAELATWGRGRLGLRPSRREGVDRTSQVCSDGGITHPAASPSWSAGPFPWTETRGAAAPGGWDRLLRDPPLELRARRGCAEQLSTEWSTRHLAGRTRGGTQAGRTAVGARDPPLPNALSLRARPPSSPPSTPAPPPAPPLLGIEHQNARLQGPRRAGNQESPPPPPGLSGCLRLLPARLPRAVQKLAPPAAGARQYCPWPSPGAYLGRRTGWTEARLR